MDTIPDKIGILTGAGISQESGLDTLRRADGTWDKVPVPDDVARLLGTVSG